MLAFTLALVACSDGSGDSTKNTDENLTIPNVSENTIERNFLPECAVPRESLSINSGWPIEIFELNGDHFAAGLKNSLAYFKLNSFDGNFVEVPENRVLDLAAQGAGVASIGSNYYFSGLGLPIGGLLYSHNLQTNEVQDIPSPQDIYILATGEIVSIGETLYFTAQFNPDGPDATFTDDELWSYKPLTAELQLHSVASGFENQTFPKALTVVGDSVLFTATSDDSSDKLFELTQTNTTPVPVSDSIPRLSDFSNLKDINNSLYFTAESNFETSLFEYSPESGLLNEVAANLDLNRTHATPERSVRGDTQYLYWFQHQTSWTDLIVSKLTLATMQQENFNIEVPTGLDIEDYGIVDGMLVFITNLIFDNESDNSADLVVLDSANRQVMKNDMSLTAGGGLREFHSINNRAYFSAQTSIGENLWSLDIGCSN